MTTGPTQNYADASLTSRRARPVLAAAVRVGAAVVPLLVALVIGAAAARWAPASRLGLPPVVWLLVVVGVAAGVLVLCSRWLRRLVPLSALLRLSLVLPDDVPHRFSLARRTWSLSALEDGAEAGDDAAGGAGGGERTGAPWLLALVGTLAAHDARTRAHGERVQAYAALIGRELGLSDDDVERLSWAALLHDVGKVHVPAEIINKGGRPTEKEWAQLQEHPRHGGELVEPLRGWLGSWLDGVEQHHERWDGKGYPLRLSGEDISLAARIIAVADTYDVITSARAYKKPMSAEQARAEITRCAGEQFDPAVVRALLSVGIRRLRLVAGPATLLAALPVLVAAPAQAVSTATAVAQVAGGHALTAVLAAGVGVSGGVAATEVVAVPAKAVTAVVADAVPATAGPTGRPAHPTPPGASSASRPTSTTSAGTTSVSPGGLPTGAGGATTTAGPVGGAAETPAPLPAIPPAAAPAAPAPVPPRRTSTPAPAPSGLGVGLKGRADEGEAEKEKAEKAKAAKDQAAKAAKDQAAKAAKEQAAKAAKEQADQAAKAAKEQADQAAKAAKEQADQAAKAAKEQADQAAKAAKDQADQAAKAAKDQADATKAAKDQAAKAAKDQADQAAKAAKDLVDQASKAAKDLLKSGSGKGKGD